MIVNLLFYLHKNKIRYEEKNDGCWRALLARVCKWMESIVMIRYSKFWQTTHTINGDVTGVYARAQKTQTMSLQKFAEHISEHYSKYNLADITAVLISAVYCLREQLLEGKKVNLGMLGDFYPSLRSKPADSMKSFTDDNITKVKVNWIPGEKFEDLRNVAEFEYLMTLEERAEKIKEVAQKTSSGSTADKDTEPGEQTGGSGTGDDGGDSGDRN